MEWKSSFCNSCLCGSVASRTFWCCNSMKILRPKVNLRHNRLDSQPNSLRLESCIQLNTGEGVGFGIEGRFVLNSLSQLVQIYGGWAFGVDNAALVWLIITSTLMVVMPPLISVIYLWNQERNQEKRTNQRKQTRVLGPARPIEPIRKQKRAA